MSRLYRLLVAVVTERRPVLLLAGLLCISGVAAAQSTTALDPYVSFRVTEWTVDDGLPEPPLAMTQTPDGYLWITTFDGLVRFDGTRFKGFTTDTTPAFRSHDFVGLYATRSGDLWVGGRDGWVYRLRGGTWTAFDVSDQTLTPSLLSKMPTGMNSRATTTLEAT